AEGARDKGEQGHGGADGAQNGKGTDTRSASIEKDKNSSHGGGATGSRGTSPDIWDEDLSEKDLWGIGKVPPSGELGDVPDDADLWGIGKASSKVSTTTPSATTNDVSKSSDTAPSEPTSQQSTLEPLDMTNVPKDAYIDKDEEVLPEIEYLENEEPDFVEETDPSSSHDGDDEANANGSALDDATLDKVLEEEQLDDVSDEDDEEHDGGDDEAELHTPAHGGQSDTNESTPSGPSPLDPSKAATQQQTQHNADSSVTHSTPSTPPSASQKPQQPFTDKNAHALLAGNTNNTIDLKKTTQQLTQQILSTIQGDTQFLDTLKDLTKDLKGGGLSLRANASTKAAACTTDSTKDCAAGKNEERLSLRANAVECNKDSTKDSPRARTRRLYFRANSSSHAVECNNDSTKWPSKAVRGKHPQKGGSQRGI
ncbi:hypothetical protein AK88_05646, partial [Plasmodium fragile]